MYNTSVTKLSVNVNKEDDAATRARSTFPMLFDALESNHREPSDAPVGVEHFSCTRRVCRG